MSYKLVISKEGYDASTETNPDNIILSSDYNTLKHYSSGNQTITITNSDYTDKSTEVEITHSLGYVPVFVVYVDDVKDSTGYNIVPYTQVSGAVAITAEAWADTTKLYLKFRNKSNANRSAHFYYKIFRNRTGL